MTRPARKEALVAALLALLPVAAHAPAWWEGRLIGPGDGAALHYPLRVQVWEAYGRGELPSWNPAIFSGAPLLAAYRPGALYPPMVLLTALPRFEAFQVLVLGSLAAAAALTFAYLRQLGAGVTGAYLAGVSFALGPYLVGHVGDTATIVAAPTLPLLLLAAERHVRRGTLGASVSLAIAFALTLLAGSPEAARAGAALVFGRLLIAHLLPGSGPVPSLRLTALAVGAALLLATPQLVPTVLAAREAGRQVTGLASPQSSLPGATGLVLRYVSHTPAPALALAALPLVLTETPIRVLGVALALCLGLQWGRGPLAAPGAWALVFDFTLAVLAGLSLSAQWNARREPRGRWLRAHFLFWSLASAGALSVAAAALGPLPQTLAGSVGVLALALILYFSLAGSPDDVRASVWLLPLTVSFLLQPHGRAVWADAPTRAELTVGTPTYEAIDHAMGRRREDRVLSLARRWPVEAPDLAYAGLGAVWKRHNGEGYDPMVPLRSRVVFEGMGVAGTLPGTFFRTDPSRLEILGVRWVQVPASALVVGTDAWGLGEPLEMTVETARRRFIPLPIGPATEVRMSSWMADAVEVPDQAPVAVVELRLASGRQLPVVVRAGIDTAEWAYDRPDVRPRVAHSRAAILESWTERGFEAHRYRTTLALPGRYTVDGLWIERLPGPGRFTVSRLGTFDALTRRSAAVSLAAGYVSDTTRFRVTATTPGVRLFELPLTLGRAHVVEAVRPVPTSAAMLHALRAPRESGFDPRREALALADDAARLAVPRGRSSRGEVVRAMGSRIEVRAEGPGVLVLAESWDPGWTAEVDGRAADVVRVNHVQMGVPLPPGMHRVDFRYHARGLAPAAALAALAAAGLAAALLKARRARRGAI